jgi:hypothetical protein
MSSSSAKAWIREHVGGSRSAHTPAVVCQKILVGKKRCFFFLYFHFRRRDNTIHVPMACSSFRFFHIVESFIENNSVIVDACIHAMENGRLSVLCQEAGLYLWEYFVFTVDQTARTCALLQRQRLPSSLLWSLGTSLQSFVRPRPGMAIMQVAKDPVTMSALSQIDFLWQDLQAVEAWLHHHHGVNTQWVQAEVDRRQWLMNPRRAWLAAVVG